MVRKLLQCYSVELQGSLCPDPPAGVEKEGMVFCSLIPRPHPLTRRNSLVNQVEFLGLAHSFATV